MKQRKKGGFVFLSIVSVLYILGQDEAKKKRGGCLSLYCECVVYFAARFGTMG